MVKLKKKNPNRSVSTVSISVLVAISGRFTIIRVDDRRHPLLFMGMKKTYSPIKFRFEKEFFKKLFKMFLDVFHVV